MDLRRAALALIVLSLITASLHTGMSPARATTVTEAERLAEQAESERDAAYEVVSEAVENRDEVESRLFEALTDYNAAVEALADANRRLDQVGHKLAAAEAESVGVSEELREQVVAAYMEAVLSPGSIVVGTDTVEQAMVVDHIFASGQTDNLAQLDQLTIQKSDLDRIRVEYEEDRAEVETLEARLAQETADLEQVFAQADAAVAAAYRRASAADAAYRAALTDVDRARAEEEARRQPETTTTTATTAPGGSESTTTTDGEPSPTTTTTTAPGDDPPPNLRPEVERWRSLVAAHFPTSRVNEALVIIQCESHGDPDAVNPYSGASGLFQFLPGTWAVASVSAGVGGASVFDPEANITAAAWLAGYYESQGQGYWTPWSCRSRL